MKPANTRRRWTPEADVTLLVLGSEHGLDHVAGKVFHRTRRGCLNRVRLLMETRPELFQRCWTGPKPKRAPDPPRARMRALTPCENDALLEIARRQPPGGEPRPYWWRIAAMERLAERGLAEPFPGIPVRKTRKAWRITAEGRRVAALASFPTTV